MDNTTTTQTAPPPLDATIKQQAEIVFASLGLTNTAALHFFYAYVAQKQRLPFAIPVTSAHDETARINAIVDDLNQEARADRELLSAVHAEHGFDYP